MHFIMQFLMPSDQLVDLRFKFNDSVHFPPIVILEFFVSRRFELLKRFKLIIKLMVPWVQYEGLEGEGSNTNCKTNDGQIAFEEWHFIYKYNYVLLISQIEKLSGKKLKYNFSFSHRNSIFV